jgi:hypothetical protein
MKPELQAETRGIIPIEDLWTRENGEETKARLYPRANFATYPSPTGYDLELVAEDRLDLGALKMSVRNSGDYFFSPHIFVSREKLWISDGHRYLPSMIGLARESGIPTGKILSIDLDYFSKTPKVDLQTGAEELIRAAIAASAEHDLVIADLHEDTQGKPEENNILSYEDTVSATDSGVIRDENFIPFIHTGRTVIIKPAISELSFTLGEKRGILITNPDFLLQEDPINDHDLSLLRYFDMIHLCTSPCYINPVKSFSILKTICTIGIN